MRVQLTLGFYYLYKLHCLSLHIRCGVPQNKFSDYSITLKVSELLSNRNNKKATKYTEQRKQNLLDLFDSIFFRLWRLYNNLETNSPLRYHVYYHVIELAARVGSVREVFSGVDQLRREFANCPPSNEQMQKLYRLLHQVLKDQNRLAHIYKHFEFTRIDKAFIAQRVC